MVEVTDQWSVTGRQVRRFLPSKDERQPVWLVVESNAYAREIEEFDAGARHLAEALQRPVLLVQPFDTVVDVRDIGVAGILAQGPAVGIVCEGGAVRQVAALLGAADVQRRTRCVVCIHPPSLPPFRDAVATYCITQDSVDAGAAWFGLPSCPLALCRWIPEIDTYLDSLRIWFDLHLLD